MLKRSTEVRPAGLWDPSAAIDRVVLDADARHRRRAVFIGDKGTRVLLDLPYATGLRHGDGLVLADGAIVGVVGKAEPLVQVAAPASETVARLAWHLGNRHTDVQIVGEALRIRRDHVLEDMLLGLGATLTPIEAPFDPESGAYAHRGHDDHHG